MNAFCAELVSDYLDDQSETDQMDSNAIGKSYIHYNFKFNNSCSKIQ